MRARVFPSAPLTWPRAAPIVTAAAVAQLLWNTRRDPAVLAAEQAARLRDILALAADAPIYRDLWPAAATTNGRDIGDIRDVRDLAALPTIDKSDLQARSLADRRTTDAPVGTRCLSSSGSTGNVLSVEYPPGGSWWQGAVALRPLLMPQGRRPWDRVAILAGDPPAPGEHGVLSRAQNWRIERIWADQSSEAAAAAILAFRPTAISGLAKSLIDIGEVLAGRCRPRVVATNGETMSPEMRAEIERLYGVAPRDGYGCIEAARLALQCHALDLYHLEHESAVVEIVDDDGNPVPPGVTGHVAVTALWNRLAPVVRYRVGDAAALADRPCRCGWAGPALARLEGRVLDWFVDAAGGRVSPMRLWLGQHVAPDVDLDRTQYQVRQDTSGALTVDLVRRPPFPPETLDAITASYRAVFGDAVPVTVRNVDAIGPTPGAKFRLFQSAQGRATRPTITGP